MRITRLRVLAFVAITGFTTFLWYAFVLPFLPGAFYNTAKVWGAHPMIWTMLALGFVLQLSANARMVFTDSVGRKQ